MDLEDKKTGHPFKTPENYFEEMESRILSEINLQKRIKKESPFMADQTFFDKLEREILSRTSEVNEEKKSPLKVVYKNTRNQMYRIAAGVLLFCGLGTSYYYYSSRQVGIDDLSSEEMVAYLEYQSISSSELASLIDPAEFSDEEILPGDLEIDENDIYLEIDPKSKSSI